MQTFQSAGRVPWLIEAWNCIVRAGDIWSAISFRSLVGIESGPEAL